MTTALRMRLTENQRTASRRRHHPRRYQLPPVPPRDPHERAYFADTYRSLWFFDAKVWLDTPLTAIELVEVLVGEVLERPSIIRLLEADLLQHLEDRLVDAVVVEDVAHGDQPAGEGEGVQPLDHLVRHVRRRAPAQQPGAQLVRRALPRGQEVERDGASHLQLGGPVGLAILSTRAAASRAAGVGP